VGGIDRSDEAAYNIIDWARARSKGDTDLAFTRETMEEGLFIQVGESQFLFRPYSGTVNPTPNRMVVDLDNISTLPPEKRKALINALVQSADTGNNEVLSALDLGRYFFDSAAEIETDQQIYRGLLGYGDLGIWLGKEKRRKSNLILELAICAALGRDFLCFKFLAPAPLRVVLIDYESKAGSLKQRYDGIVTALGLRVQDRERLRDSLCILQVKKIRKAGHAFPSFRFPVKARPLKLI
jgi:hypothetical protein